MRGLFLSRSSERAETRRLGRRLAVKAANWEQRLAELSGGNQQKVVIAKWLATRPKVIILDEPTKGIDVGSKAAVHDFIGELAAEGLAVVLITSELPEVMGLADRVIVMKEGRIVDQFKRGVWSAEADRRRGDRRREGGRVRRLFNYRELILALILSSGVASIGAYQPVFLRWENISDMLTETSVLFMMALAQMVVILTRGIDLSVAANLALSGMCAALVSQYYPKRRSC